jgi:hypothetical protein
MSKPLTDVQKRLVEILTSPVTNTFYSLSPSQVAARYYGERWTTNYQGHARMQANICRSMHARPDVFVVFNTTGNPGQASPVYCSLNSKWVRE